MDSAGFGGPRRACGLAWTCCGLPDPWVDLREGKVNLAAGAIVLILTAVMILGVKLSSRFNAGSRHGRQSPPAACPGRSAGGSLAWAAGGQQAERPPAGGQLEGRRQRRPPVRPGGLEGAPDPLDVEGQLQRPYRPPGRQRQTRVV
jgi:hypothetical protein